MQHYFAILIAITSVLIAGVMGCSDTDKVSDETEENSITTNPATAGESDEESKVQLALTDTYDNVRRGAHLILSYDAAGNSFKGTVRNTTDAVLPQVRVEVHLSNGVELGPTPPVDLAPGAQIPIELMAEGPAFDKWTAHPEVGGSGGEHGEGGHAHGAEGGGEHGEGGGHD